MKIVLLETIEGIGSVGQEVRVKDGYARNYLIPKGLALTASDKNLNAFKGRIQARVRSEAKSREQALKVVEQLEGVDLSFTVKTGQEGKLFGSITPTNIYDALKEKGFDVDKKKIALPEPIRHIGIHEVSIGVYPGVSAQLKVEVSAESEE